jgi:hypothetical protein
MGGLVEEARLAAADVRAGLAAIAVAAGQGPAGGVLLEVLTKEGAALRVELTLGGYRVLADAPTPLSVCRVPVAGVASHGLGGFGCRYETLHALLDSRSAEYRRSFAQQLAARLVSVRRQRGGGVGRAPVAPSHRPPFAVAGGPSRRRSGGRRAYRRRARAGMTHSGGSRLPSIKGSCYYFNIVTKKRRRSKRLSWKLRGEEEYPTTQPRARACPRP